MLEELKKRVLEANLLLPKYNLVTFTWGNVSEISEDRKYVAIKPSGVSYDAMRENDIVIVDMNGNVVDGSLKPSSDLATHLEIYKNFNSVKGVCHTHSTYATAFAQSKTNIKALGTTHADNFYGDIPCTRLLKNEEIDSDYELNTGRIIIETFLNNNINPDEMPGVLVASHGPFTWGKSAKEAVEHSVVLEEISKMNYFTANINNQIDDMQKSLLDKHFLRKHGKNAYYGQ